MTEPTVEFINYTDPAELPIASHWPDMRENSRDCDFLDKFCEMYGVTNDDLAQLKEWVQVESARTWTEQFHKLLGVFHDCRVPAAVIFAAILRAEGEKIRDTAKLCGVSHTAVYKHVLWEQEVLKIFGIRNSYARNGKVNKKWYTFNDKCEIKFLKGIMDFSSQVRRVFTHGLLDEDKRMRDILLSISESLLKDVVAFLKRA